MEASAAASTAHANQVAQSGGGGEAGAALEALKILLAAGLDIKGVVSNRALRGVHIDVRSSLGLISIVKVPTAPGGGPKSSTSGSRRRGSGRNVPAP